MRHYKKKIKKSKRLAKIRLPKSNLRSKLLS